MSQVVLAGSIRTPIGAFLGTLSDISTVDLGTICAQESIRRANVPVDQIDEVILGHVLAATQGKSFISVGNLLQRFFKITHYLERILMEHIGQICRLGSKLQIESICSIMIL